MAFLKELKRKEVETESLSKAKCQKSYKIISNNINITYGIIGSRHIHFSPSQVKSFLLNRFVVKIGLPVAHSVIKCPHY